MLDINFVRENMEAIESKIRDRKLSIDLAGFIQLEGDRRRLLVEIEQLRYLRNRTTEKIAELKRQNKDVRDEIAEMKKVSTQIKLYTEQLRSINKNIEKILYMIPNLPHPSVPVGCGEESNIQVRSWGEKTSFDFEPLAHWDLGKNSGTISFRKAAKITGSRFALLVGFVARLERALINFMLDLHTAQHNYREIAPPFIVNRQSMFATGQLPHLEDDVFRIEGSEYFLIPTGEVPLTNIHRDEILSESILPLNYVACTPCFRREAGSWGKETRGLIRLHQFNKIELLKLVRPEDSYDELEYLVTHAEKVLQLLELPYRVMSMCTAELRYTASKGYDIEVWIPTQNRYREVSSCCNFEDFQARRAEIRYRPIDSSKTEYVHTINGSGLAIGRTLVAVLENFQNSDGSIRIPRVLQSYLNQQTIFSPEKDENS